MNTQEEKVKVLKVLLRLDGEDVSIRNACYWGTECYNTVGEIALFKESYGEIAFPCEEHFHLYCNLGWVEYEEIKENPSSNR